MTTHGQWQLDHKHERQSEKVIHMPHILQKKTEQKETGAAIGSTKRWSTTTADPPSIFLFPPPLRVRR